MTALTLPEFLLARFSEDEAAAKDTRWLGLEYGVDSYGQETFAARVLVECEAKRRIVEMQAYDRPKLGAPPYNGPLTDIDGGRHPDLVAYIEEHGEQVTDTPILRILALPYADHPDYREEWKL